MRKRTILKTFYLSEEEEKLLKEKAKKVNYNESEVIRSLIKNFKPKEKPDDRFYEYLRLLRNISNNLNQIATKANSLGYIDTTKYMEEVDKVDEFILKVKKEFLLP